MNRLSSESVPEGEFKPEIHMDLDVPKWVMEEAEEQALILDYKFFNSQSKIQPKDILKVYQDIMDNKFIRMSEDESENAIKLAGGRLAAKFLDRSKTDENRNIIDEKISTIAMMTNNWNNIDNLQS